MRNPITIMGFDLGKHLGWCKCACSLKPNLHMNVLDHGTIYLDQLTTERMKRDYNEILSPARVRSMVYEESIRRLVDQGRYDCFAVEDVFCNPSRIPTFRSLTIYKEILEKIINLEKERRLYAIPPTVCKQIISGYGHSDKTQVQQAILNNPAITVKKIENASEHEFDAIAIAFVYMSAYVMNNI